MRWYTKESMSAQGLKTVKLTKWSVVIISGTPAPFFEKWTPENKAKLKRLKKEDIKMDDTTYAYGKLPTLQ